MTWNRCRMCSQTRERQSRCEERKEERKKGKRKQAISKSGKGEEGNKPERVKQKYARFKHAEILKMIYVTPRFMLPFFGDWQGDKTELNNKLMQI